MNTWVALAFVALGLVGVVRPRWMAWMRNAPSRSLRGAEFDPPDALLVTYRVVGAVLVLIGGAGLAGWFGA